LRSRRLLDACRELPFDGLQMEDVLICRAYREQLEQQGMRFAPESVARKFSFERTSPTGCEFGFHGSFNLIKLMRADVALRVIHSLEPQVLARSERHEILRWALMRGRLKLALALLARLL
jgi:hypothetical protein